MKNKIIAVGVVLVSLLTVIIFLIINANSNSIPDDYIAVFHGESVNTNYYTYIYKIDNGHANMGFTYINAVTINDKTTIKETGEISWTEDVFVVARKHGSYDYVKVPDDDKKYSIKEFQERFIMN